MSQKKKVSQKIINTNARTTNHIPRHVRMRDVAEMAGVAITTVSRVLTNPEQVSPKTLNAVKNAIETLNYLPNNLARTLRSNRSNVIAVLVPNISHSAFAETLQGMADHFRTANYQLLIGHTGYSLLEEAKLVATLLSRRPDGIVLTGYTHHDATIRLLKAARIPIVEMWNVKENPLDMMVGFSNYDAAKTMTRHLLDRGYTRIGYIGGPPADNDRTAQREAGFCDALKEAGILPSIQRMAHAQFEFEAGADCFNKIMMSAPDTHAIFTGSDILAIGVMLECAARGWAIPARIAVAGFDDARMASLMTPKLTTIRVHKYEIGRKSAELMLSRLADPTVPTTPRVVDVGFELISRESVGYHQ